MRGHAVGAGFQLALACDLIVAAPDAQFAMRETSYGLVPDLAGTWPLVNTVGYPKALEMCLTGRSVTAEEAWQCGLVARISEDPMAGALEVAESVRRAPTGAAMDLKPLLRGAAMRTPQEQWAAERAAQSRRLRTLLTGGA